MTARRFMLTCSDVAALSRQVELALVYDGKIDVTKTWKTRTKMRRRRGREAVY
jgi:hypothetical protein